MRIPTEEEIEVICSELESNQKAEHEDDKDHSCDFCELMKEFNHRGRTNQEVPNIDKIAMNSISNSPMSMLFAMVGPESLTPVLRAVRVAFLIGLKLGAYQESNKQLAALIDLPDTREKE